MSTKLMSILARCPKEKVLHSNLHVLQHHLLSRSHKTTDPFQLAQKYPATIYRKRWVKRSFQFEKKSKKTFWNGWYHIQIVSKQKVLCFGSKWLFASKCNWLKRKHKGQNQTKTCCLNNLIFLLLVHENLF